MELKKLIAALEKSTKTLWGMAVYEKVGNGCLNGLWTNNHHTLDNCIMNEIARKKDGENKNDFSGNYTVSYIEPDNIAYTGKLTINRNGSNGIYDFDWEINIPNPAIFKGVGMQTGEKQLTVIYWQL